MLHDIDNDGVNEALVFYKLESEPSKEHMNVLDNVNGKWVSVNDFSGTGTGVNFVSFVQMTETGCPAILVSQSLYENDASKILSFSASAFTLITSLDIGLQLSAYFA